MSPNRSNKYVILLALLIAIVRITAHFGLIPFCSEWSYSVDFAIVLCLVVTIITFSSIGHTKKETIYNLLKVTIISILIFEPILFIVTRGDVDTYSILTRAIVSVNVIILAFGVALLYILTQKIRRK